MRHAVLFAGVAVALALAGCAYSEKVTRDVDIGPLAFEDAWNSVVEIAAVDGMALDVAATDRGNRVLQTQWRTRMGPFRGSVRRRLHAEFEQPEGGKHWLVRFYVEKQTVGDIAKGFSAEEDDWEPDGQDSDIENRIAAKLHIKFRGGIPVEAKQKPTLPGRH